MTDLLSRLEKDFGQYKLFLNVLFTLATTDEHRRTLYESLVACEEYINGIEDKRIKDLYARVVEDCRLSISRAILDSDYRAFYTAAFQRANAVEQAIDLGISALKLATT